MPSEQRRRSKGTSRVDLSSASEPEQKQLQYRGKLIQPAQRGIYCAAIAEIPILPGNLVDQGVKAYFEKKKNIKETDGRISYAFFKDIRIDQIMNAKTDAPEKIFDRFGLTPYLPEGNTGVVVLGRDPFCPSSVEEFASGNNSQYDKFYEIYDKEFIDFLQDPEDFKSFQETARGYGIIINKLDDIKQHIKIEAIPRFMEIYSDWSFSRQAKIPFSTGKRINADIWNNTGISALIDDDDKKPNAQGLIMQLGDTTYWVDYSSNGSTVIFLGKRRDDIGRLCQTELELDRNEKIFKGKAGNGKLEDFVTDYFFGGKIVGTKVNLLRKEDNSPVVFVPLVGDAMISMGHRSPITKKQQSTLYIK